MNKSERLQREKRKIKKRLKIVRSWSTQEVLGKKHPLEEQPHRLAKAHLNCADKRCNAHKHDGNSRAQRSNKKSEEPEVLIW